MIMAYLIINLYWQICDSSLKGEYGDLVSQSVVENVIFI